MQNIPDKQYFTIGDVSTLCQLKAHVLRYWEQEFKQLSPVRRRGNRRYYQRKDIQLIQQIKFLLYEQGFTISGAKSRLGNTENKTHATSEKTNEINSIIDELNDIRKEISK